MKKGLKYTLIGICDNWCCVQVDLFNCNFFICSVYLRPNVPIYSALEAFEALITSIHDSFSDPKIVIGGDFNCRIENLGECDPNLTVNTILHPIRRSLDSEKPSASGVVLMEFMAENGLHVLNGRVPGDIPGHFTFAGHQGRSVIDLIFTNFDCAEFVSNFTVDTTISSSDHFPINFLLSEQMSATVGPAEASQGPRLKWCPENAQTFSKYMEETTLVASVNLSVDSLYENLCRAIWDAADEAGMLLNRRKNSYVSKQCCRIEKKPWFDSICLASKKENVMALKTAKKFDFAEPYLSHFVECKLDYNRVKIEKKKAFESDIRKQLAAVKNASEFWAAVRFCRNKGYSPGLPPEIWNEFYRHIYPPRVPYDFRTLTNKNSWLDGPITAAELDLAFDRCKKGKAPIKYQMISSGPCPVVAGIIY